MKLIWCGKCRDVIALRHEKRTCFCGESHGKYREDGLTADIGGPCLPLGFANSSFIGALRNQPETSPGETFTAFVIEKKCPTVIVEGK